MIPTYRCRPMHENGFTLIEVLAGIAVTSILLLGVFQFLTDVITLRSMIQDEGIRKHRIVSAYQLVQQDLMAIPRGKRNFVARRNRFERTTVTYETNETKLLDTRVRYRILEEEGQEVLYREWKWLDIHQQFQEEEALLRGDDLSLRYRIKGGQWVRSVERESVVVRAVEINWNDRRMVVPVGYRNREI